MNLMSRELAVIQILWDAEEPITVVGIVVREENETIDSVQWGTKNLLKKNLIAIEDYTQMENKIAHRLKPLVKQESIEIPTIATLVNNLVSKNISASHIMAALLPTDHTQKP